MKPLSVSLALGLCLILSDHVIAQQNLVYNHYFLDPYLYNPSFIAADGYTEMNLNFRRQWSDFQGAPTTLSANLQVPVNYKLAWGVNLYNDKAGVLQTNTGFASLAYKVFLGRSTDDNHKIGFGLSMGYSMYRIDLSKVDDVTDPSLTNSNTSNLTGQFGMHYQFNRLKIGFALPRLFADKLVSEEAFNSPAFEALKNTFYSISYDILLSRRVGFEPTVTYRTFEAADDQFEVLGAFRIDNLLWAGGSYRQDYGPGAFLGFVVKEKLKVGYAYEFAPKVVNGLGTGSHEVHVSVRLGKTQKNRPQATGTTVSETRPVQEEIAVRPEPRREEVPEEPVVVERVEVETPVEPPTVVEPPKQEAIVERPAVTPDPVVTPVTQPAETELAQAPVSDLPPGHYVIVGSFLSAKNAERYVRQLRAAGYPGVAIFYAPRNYNYVHVGRLSVLSAARSVRDEYRARNRFFFKDAWILSIEK